MCQEPESKCFRQSGLAKNCVRGVAAWDADRHGEVPLGDRAVPDFVAAFALPHEHTTCIAQQIAQRTVELRSHSGGDRFGFFQRRDLKEQIGGIDAGVVVRQQIERHCGNLRQQFIQRRGVGGGGNVVAVAAPHGGFVVPCGGYREDHRF
jgi:hypothetical protein